jgi:transcriptional regulator with XRE-family HTH domain
MPRLKLSTLDSHRKIFNDFVNYRASECDVQIRQLGERMGISESTMHKYKKYPGAMSLDDLLKMANLLNMDPRVLLAVYAEGKRPWEQKASTWEQKEANA